ncbi:MAG: flagellar filament capping protein FliD [Burkholderiaceae bacterium]
MALSSPGIGSGLDVNSIVTQLVAIERRPIEQLALRKTTLSAELSSYGLLQSYMSNLQSAATQLTKPDFWNQSGIASSAADTVSASSTADASPASYQVEVTKLAQATSLSSNAFAADTAFDAGTMTISVGANAIDVAIDAGDTIEAVRTKINAADAGVTASIVRDAGGARLLITGNATGADNAVTVATTAGNLKGFSYPPDGTDGMTQQLEARQAEFTINGIALTSASNKLSGVIDGVSLTLSKETTDPVTVTVSRNTDALRKGIQDFVNAYNEANKYLSQQTKYDSATSTAGSLQGDRAAVGLQQRMRALVQESSDASPAFGRLSDLGLEMQRDGSLKVNDTKLNAALENPKALALAFKTTTTGFAQRFKSLADGAIGTDGTLTSRVEGLRSSITRNEKDQQRYEDRVAATQKRLLRQYSALDLTLNKLNGLNSYISQQITNWNKTKDY